MKRTLKRELNKGLKLLKRKQSRTKPQMGRFTLSVGNQSERGAWNDGQRWVGLDRSISLIWRKTFVPVHFPARSWFRMDSDALGELACAKKVDHVVYNFAQRYRSRSGLRKINARVAENRTSVEGLAWVCRRRRYRLRRAHVGSVGWRHHFGRCQPLILNESRQQCRFSRFPRDWPVLKHGPRSLTSLRV